MSPMSTWQPTRTNLKTKEFSTSKHLEIIHADLCGPTRTPTLQGEIFFSLFVDDYTKLFGYIL